MKRFVSAAVLLLAATFTVAQDKNAIPLPPAPKPNVDKAAKTPADYSQEAFVIQELKSRVRFDNDGTGFREMTIRVQVNSAFGVQQWGQLVFGYSSANEKIDIHYVRVVKPDKSVTNAPPDPCRTSRASVAAGAHVHRLSREAHHGAALRPGDTLEYHRHHHHEGACAQPVLAQLRLRSQHHRAQRSAGSQRPQGRRSSSRPRIGYKAEVTTEGDRKIYRWKKLQHSSVSPTKNSRKSGRRKLHHEEDHRRLQLTTFQSWEELGKWYAPLQRDRIKATPEIKAKAIELTKDKKTELDKIKALYDFVAPEFRYVSLSFGVGRYQPHSAGEIFANKYGDCKDKHTLLSTMLDVIGIHADPVLINSERQLDPDVPSPGQFDHVITLVTLHDGKHIWLDTTTEVAPFGCSATRSARRRRFGCRLTASRRSSKRPPNSPVPNEQNVNIDGKINDVGTLTAKIHFTSRGDCELLFRSAFRNAPETEWKDMCGNLGLKGDASEVHVSNPADTNMPFELAYTLTIPNYMAWSSKTPAFAVPLPQVSFPRYDETSDDAGPDHAGGAPWIPISRSRSKFRRSTACSFRCRPRSNASTAPIA